MVDIIDKLANADILVFLDFSYDPWLRYCIMGRHLNILDQSRKIIIMKDDRNKIDLKLKGRS